MKKVLILIVAAIASVAGIKAQTTLPPQKETLKQMIKVNNYFMKKYSDPSAVMPYYSRKKVYEANIWTRAVYYEGLMALYSIYPENRYYDYTYAWGDAHNWGMRKDDTTTRNADNYCAGQTYIDMYNLAQEPKMLTKTLACMNMLVNTPQVDDWTWIDAIQMGMPVLTKMGKLKGEQKYFDKAWDMYEWSRNTLAGGLYNPKEGLWWRDADFVPPYKEPNGKNCYWARGNGWVIAALARILEDVPANDPNRKTYVADFKAMCKAIKDCQREDGFWNVSMHDESNYGGKESTGTALFVYGMAWGINNGILSKEEYLPSLAKGWNAIINEAVHQDTGFLGYVQGTGKEPKDGQPVTYTSMPDFEDYGIGCFLLAGSEVYKLK